MNPREMAAVVFAEVLGGAGAISGCLPQLREATRAAGGEVVKTIGDEMMASFATPDAAAAASAQMQCAMGTARGALALRIGFQAGPVIRRDGDLFGDTVNLAARLAEQATRGQILTSRATAELLSPGLRASTRLLYCVEVRGKRETVQLCELLWQQSADVTDVALHDEAPPVRLRVCLGAREIQAADGGVHAGRDKDCDLVVDDELVSRRHCTLQQRHGKFILLDHSANGTYLTVEGGDEIELRREEFVLRGHGWIALGQPRARSVEVLEFFCE